MRELSTVNPADVPVVIAALWDDSQPTTIAPEPLTPWGNPSQRHPALWIRSSELSVLTGSWFSWDRTRTSTSCSSRSTCRRPSPRTSRSTFAKLRHRAGNLLDGALGMLPFDETLTDLGKTDPRNETSIVTPLMVTMFSPSWIMAVTADVLDASAVIAELR